MDLKKNARYQATVTLSGFEQIASNVIVAAKLQEAGFINVTVTGTGKHRQVVGMWPQADLKNAPIPKQITEIKEL